MVENPLLSCKERNIKPSIQNFDSTSPIRAGASGEAGQGPLAVAGDEEGVGVGSWRCSRWALGAGSSEQLEPRRAERGRGRGAGRRGRGRGRGRVVGEAPPRREGRGIGAGAGGAGEARVPEMRAPGRQRRRGHRRGAVVRWRRQGRGRSPGAEAEGGGTQWRRAEGRRRGVA
ncbi:hypothetical protein EJB05_26193, partial [Eragrostis curvula]